MKGLLQKGGKLNMTEIPRSSAVQRNFKDTLFRKIFNDEEKLLSLYNAVNNTDYDDPKDLRINTLENVIYLDIKNDVSFIIGFHLNLYEHQSTYNPNMPLRNLFYISRLLETEISINSLYAPVALELHFPSFVVFYNGTREQPEQLTMRLSDLYKIKPSSPKLELEVLMLNINHGKNLNLLEQCQVLKEYAYYVEKVREHALNMEIRNAVELAVTESIKEGVLVEFLTKYRAEAIQMSIFEYDAEKENEKIRHTMRQAVLAESAKARNEGRNEGRNEERIAIIRKMHQTGKLTTEIVSVLGFEESYVKAVIEILSQSPELSDADIAEKFYR